MWRKGSWKALIFSAVVKPSNLNVIPVGSLLTEDGLHTINTESGEEITTE